MERIVYLVEVWRVFNGDDIEIREEEHIPVAVLLSKEEAVTYANKYIQDTIKDYEARADETIKHLDPYDPDVSDEYDYFVTWSSADEDNVFDYEDLDIGVWFVDYSKRKKGETYEPDKIGEWLYITETRMIINKEDEL
jgi:hypothetical protein